MNTKKSVRFFLQIQKCWLPVTLHQSKPRTLQSIFLRSQLLVNFDGSFEQKNGPLYAANGPTLEIEVTGDRTISIDLQNTYLEVECKIVKSDSNLNYVIADASQQDTPVFVNNPLHSLFSDCTVTTQGVKVSSANGLYAHKVFIETEISHNKEAKNTWLECQGYNYESNPSTNEHFDSFHKERSCNKIFSHCNFHLAIFSRAKNVFSVELSREHSSFERGPNLWRHRQKIQS